MARKKRRPSKKKVRTQRAIENAIVRAARQMAWTEEEGYTTARKRHAVDAFLPHPRKMTRRVKGAALVTTRPPRQISLTDPKRNATIRAMEIAAGKPIGRKTRKNLRDALPRALYETLCKRKRIRREVMFAQRTAGKGVKAAARRPRQLEMGKC